MLIKRGLLWPVPLRFQDQEKRSAYLDFWFHQKMLQITSEVARGKRNHYGRNVSSETRFTGTFRPHSTWHPGAPGAAVWVRPSTVLFSESS